MKKWPIALQVYTVRDAAEADFAGTMRKVKEMGYDGVELAGTYGMTVVEMKKILDEIGLELVSAHVGLDLLRSGKAVSAASPVASSCCITTMISSSRRSTASMFSTATMHGSPRICCRPNWMFAGST